MAFDNQEFLNQFGSLTVKELNELVKTIEERFDVSSKPVASTQVAVNSGPVVEAQTEFNVMLMSAGAQKIPVIKAVRELTLLGLKEAKDLVDSAPCAIKEGISLADAESAKKKLEEVGATVELK